MAIDFEKVPSPCYLLDENALRINLDILRLVREAAGVRIICALKGFAFWYAFPMLAEYLDGAAASSLHETRLIAEEMGREAHTYCPVYEDETFDQLLMYSSHLTFNSFSQYHRYADRVRQSGKAVSLGLRINPEYSEVETDLYNPALPGSRLGLTRDMCGSTLPEGIEGLHFHTLCENNSDVLERTLQALEAKFGDWLCQVRWVNMGGGHWITQDGYDIERLVRVLKSFRERYPNLEEVILEPGEAVGLHTGYLVSTVRDLLSRPSFRIAMLDVSFACHMPDCLEMPYKPVILGAHDPEPEDQFVYRMGGNSCLAGDYMGMGDYAFDEPLEIGERIVFDDMIHYTMVKTTYFNGVRHPYIAVWTGQDELKVLRAFDYEDYKYKLS
ncbi:MAG: carboxynorspermidine decarboxylase [Bacteroidales bacterium]|nr:carboxynorspermidine decarboxylase [Bacteroidales bacterium]